MIGSMSLQEVQMETGGVITGANAEFCAASIDTRTLQPGDLFVAIKGPNFNGNEFVSAAAEKSASAVIVDESVNVDLPVLTVSDTRDALGTIGAMNRNRSGACVLGLTGSQGKTTVKEMTGAILSQCDSVMMTSGNLNNELGVPLSLLKIDKQHKYAVIEMGANGPGDIAYSVALARPDIAHITCIAGTHLEGFGDLHGVAKGKSEIWSGIRENGTAVVNLDDFFAPQFVEQIKSLGRHIVTVSGSGNKDADYFADDIQLDQFQGAGFKLNSAQGTVAIKLQVPGKHNINNAMAAAAMAMTAGAGLDAVKVGLEQFAAVKGRMCIVAGIHGATLVDDSYNASPASFRAAIDVLAQTRGSRIVVMGDMGELGSEAEKEHAEIGRYAKQQGIDCLIALGEMSALAVPAFGDGGIYLSERNEFKDTIAPLLNATTTVLIKGSRSQSMEKLVSQIQDDAQ